MPRIAVLCQGGDNCPGKASVRLGDHGRCELVLEQDDQAVCFPCSLSALINVGLGARTHLASDFGSCTLSRKPGGVKIMMTPWGDTPAAYLVPLSSYADALDCLAEVRSMQSRVSMR